MCENELDSAFLAIGVYVNSVIECALWVNLA